MITTAPLALPAALYVCLHLRPADAAEVHGMRGDDNPVTLAADVIGAAARSGLAWCVTWRGRPAALLGAHELWPGVWEGWALGTDDWPRVRLAVTRLALRELRPALRARGAHRLQAHSRWDHVEAHGWLRLLGANDELVLGRYGRDASDYVLFSWG